ncbi:MAG: single-stranded DNA-binding protein [Anaerovoracaceae bacterium]|jgi:primosomal replication protein N
MDNSGETNRVELSGKVLSPLEFSHKSYGESFYIFVLGTERKSGYCDEIKVLLSERLIWEGEPVPEDRVRIKGQIRTYNEFVDGANRLNVLVFARDFGYEDSIKDDNKVMLEGYLCKPPICRTSPLGRDICDLMLAVNRMYNKSDYIPCIAWGRNAGYAGSLSVGMKICVSGRMQSREYRKRNEKGESITKVAYEVSILKIEE